MQDTSCWYLYLFLNFKIQILDSLGEINYSINIHAFRVIVKYVSLVEDGVKSFVPMIRLDKTYLIIINAAVARFGLGTSLLRRFRQVRILLAAPMFLDSKIFFLLLKKKSKIFKELIFKPKSTVQIIYTNGATFILETPCRFAYYFRKKSR